MKHLLLFAFLGLSLSGMAQERPGYSFIKKAFNTVNNNSDSSIVYAKKAIAIGKEKQDSLLIGLGQLEMGRAYRVKNDANRSMKFLLNALTYLPKNKEGNDKASVVYSELGNLYYTLGENAKSKAAYLKAFQIKINLKKDKAAALIATQLASIYSIDPNSDSTFFYADYALPHIADSTHKMYLGNLYNAMGAAYQMKYELDSAIVYFKKAKKILEHLKLSEQSAALSYNIAGIYVEKGQFKLAEQFYLNGLDLVSEKSNVHTEMIIYGSLSRLYFRTKDYEKYAQVDLIHDSLSKEYYSLRKNKAILELEEKYESAQKDKALREKQIKVQQTELELANEQERFYFFLLLFIIGFVILSMIVVFFIFKQRSDLKIEKIKEKFFSNIVHEIRTPLTLISGPVQSLKSSSSDLNELNKLNLIERNTKRLKTLVDQLLDISKIDAKKYQLNYSYGNTMLFLNDIIERLIPFASEKNISINAQTSNLNVNIKTDFDALEKILVNLLSNAIKYSDENTAIELSGSIQESHIQIYIKDQGHGIATKHQKRIFERFDRGNRSDSNQGIGIGLSLVGELIKLMNGSIELNSIPKQGSTFNVKIPVEIAETSHEIINPLEDVNSILLLEDDDDMADFISTILTEKGHHVYRAENGIEAFKYLANYLPNLIISDVMMPQMDGYTFVSKIKSTPLLSHLPVILLSAKTAKESKLKGLEMGADLYLEKPFNPDELLLIIQNNLSTLENNRHLFHEQITAKDLSFEEKIASKDPLMQKMNLLILEEIDNPDFSVEILADKMAISRSQLHRKVKAITGNSISAYIRIIRLEKAIELLKNQQGNITEVAYATGFNSQSYFTKCFVAHFGYPPSDINKA